MSRDNSQWSWELSYQKDEGHSLRLFSNRTRDILVQRVAIMALNAFHKIPFDMGEQVHYHVAEAIDRVIAYTEKNNVEMAMISLDAADPLVVEYFYLDFSEEEDDGDQDYSGDATLHAE